jgi:uncharacterized protein
MNWKRVNIAVHRDLGYFFVFMVLVYAVSGIAMNHVNDWNPDFYVEKKEVTLNLPDNFSAISNDIVLNKLEEIGEDDGFLMIDQPSDQKIKIYFNNGSMLYDLNLNKGQLERVSKRPVFFEINFVHRNPNGLWMWFSDIFAVALIILSFTGLFILQGKKGLKGRGKWISLSGAGITLVLMFLIIN